MRRLEKLSQGEMGSTPLGECQESPAREHSTPTLVRESKCILCVCVTNCFIITASMTEIMFSHVGRGMISLVFNHTLQGCNYQ